MLSRKLKHRSLAALAGAGAMFLAATASQAAILPSPTEQNSTPDIQLAWCAVGAHIGPVGACIGGPGYYHHYHHCWINHWGHRVCN
jgi:hypothetical protein